MRDRRFDRTEAREGPMGLRDPLSVLGVLCGLGAAGFVYVAAIRWMLGAG